MLPEDIQDLIIAFALLIILAVGIPLLSFAGKTYKSQIPDLNDESKLFLINYLKTETGDGQIADLIALSEDQDNTLIQLQKASEKIFNFYNFKDNFGQYKNRNYILKVGYPDGKINLITASGAWGLPSLASSGSQTSEEQKKKWFELGNGEKVQIPSLKGGLITVELEVEDE